MSCQHSYCLGSNLSCSGFRIKTRRRIMVQYNFDEIIDRKNTQSSKWDNVGARTGNANAIPMWVADTDFRCPQPIIDAIRNRAGHIIYGYPYVPPEFQEVTASWLKRRHDWEIEPNWVVFSTGIVPVINTMIQEFTDPDDEVIIQEPVYHQFRIPILDNERKIVSNDLIYENGQYSMDIEDLKKKVVSDRAKLMILCSPHNPVGRVWGQKDLMLVAEICRDNGVILISDEIHSDLMLYGHKHIPVASLNKIYAENIITCVAPSKTFNIAGLRGSAVIISNPQIRKRLEARFKKNKSVQQNVFAIPAYIAAYTQCDDYLEQLISYIEDNVEFLDNFLKEKTPAIKLVRPESTYLMWLDCTETRLFGDTLNDFFVKNSLVAIRRGDQFGGNGANFVRLNIACPQTTLRRALENIFEQYCMLKINKYE